MDWFYALDTPAQVALIGVLTAIVGAASGVAVAVVNKARGGEGGHSKQAELAAVTLDSTAIKQVAAAIEALNLTMLDQARTQSTDLKAFETLAKALIKELSEIREEIRHQGEGLRK